MINPHIVRKTTNPVDAPPEAGIHWINTTTGEEFFSVDTQFVADWVPRRDVSIFIGDEIINGQTNIAPSQNAVFDALALKVDKSGTKVLSDNNYTTVDKNLVGSIEEKRKYLSVGVFDSTAPLLTDNGDGTCNIASCTFIMHSTSDFTGNLEKYTVPAITNLGPFDSTGKYVAINYNSGSPIYQIKTSSEINGSNIVPIYKCWFDGLYLHSLDSDSQGLGLSNKISNMIISTMPYSRAGQSGLMLSESATRIIDVSSAYVFAGTTGNVVSTYTSATDICTFVYYNGSSWIYDRSTTQYNNSQYNNGSGLQTLSNGKYTVNWIYRSIGDVKEVFYVLGSTQYNNIADAQLSKKRTDIPSLITQHSMLVGRIIVLKSASTGTVESTFDTQFQSSVVSNHNDLSNKQGGIVDEYYHLTSQEYSKLQNSISVTSTISSGGTLNLTSTSSDLQIITGTLTHTIVLPFANALGTGISQKLVIKNRSTGNVTINRGDSDTIDGVISLTLTFNQAVTLMSNGSNQWVVV